MTDVPQPPAPPAPATRSTRWISQGLERLIHDTAHRLDTGRAADFDVVIVGSGYGGAIAAERLAGLKKADGSPVTVCVLERGREYLPGAFPDRLADLAGHVRFNTAGTVGARGRLDGLFDMRLGDDVSVLLANGLGGGSLINAGVMAFPHAAVFADPAWPRVARAGDAQAPAIAFPSHAVLVKAAEGLQRELGARVPEASGTRENGVSDTTFGKPLARAAVMKKMGASAVPITVALADRHTTSAHVVLEKCVACGDCATGCNVGAKESLDTNLLVRAHRKGARLVTGATVERVQRSGAAWRLSIWHTNADLRGRMADAFTLTARQVILAAGTLGSTDILLRSQTGTQRFSGTLGHGFSGNGDVLAAAFDTGEAVFGVAREATAPGVRQVGPTITSMIDRRSASGSGFVVQDLGVPGPLRRLFEEATATAATLHDLETADTTRHTADAAMADPCAIDPRKVDRSLAVALICRDTADGVMHAVADGKQPPRDAGVSIAWASAKHDKRLDEACDWFKARLDSSGVGGQALPNPVWRMLPKKMESLLGADRGSLVSVHPLGGCRMGSDRGRGVVNGLGQVFDAAHASATGLHDGLVVLDGAIVPTSLGINPSLTIATLADFAVRELATLWGFSAGPAEAPAPPAPRPVFKDVRANPWPPAVPTQVEVVEQLLGPCDLDGKTFWVELTLHYVNTPLHRDEAPSLAGHRLEVSSDNKASRVRVFAHRPDLYASEFDDAAALFVAPVSGHLQFFHREASTEKQRRKRAWSAWWTNRGARDAYQAAGEGLQDGLDRLVSPSRWFKPGEGDDSPSALERLRQSEDLATRAGEVRLFDYVLATGVPVKADGAFAALSGSSALPILGSKRLTYSLRCSPWAQLMQMTLRAFGPLRVGPSSVLGVEPFYFAKRQVPLMRVARQQDQPSALVDVGAFALYVARILVKIHLWSFRKPDAPEPRTIVRLPRSIKGLPAAQVIPLTANDGVPFQITRYRSQRTTGPVRPVLMVHGYSANGRSFAHETLQEGGLAGYLARRGFEPWVVDLRTSSGLKSSTAPWRFEDVALNDLPVAIARICEDTGQDRIDVVSHCMGSAMLAMSMLAPDPGTGSRYPVERHVRRWVMSQIGPAMRFAPANTLRAFLMRYVQQMLPDLKYELTPGGATPGASADLFDRFLSGLPYLEDDRGSEFTVENPTLPWKRTPWVGTRHRLDALIGRTFDARRVSEDTLHCIDDFFGPLSLVTMSQPIHFARQTFVTDMAGLNAYGLDRVTERLSLIKMLSFHSDDNGLADPSTHDAMQTLADEDRLDWEGVKLPDQGHQDCLIGDNTDRVFRKIHDFLA